MARSVRIEYPGAVYHIISRGNAGELIYRQDRDRQSFLDTLGEVTSYFNWLLHAYCLMDNHYHILVEIPGGELSRGMQKLNSVYTQKFNHNHKRIGHLFHGRFKALLVEKESYLLELCRYIVLNPVRAGVARSPSEWRWSSYRATAGEEEGPAWLEKAWILSQFGVDVASARKEYVSFVAEGIDSWTGVLTDETSFALGSEHFKSSLQEFLQKKKHLLEIPRHQQRLCRPALEEIFSKVKFNRKNRLERNAAVFTAAREYGYRHREIGDYLGLHHATISKIIVGYRKRD